MSQIKVKRKIFSRVALKFSGLVCFVILIIMLLMASLILQQTKQSLIKEMEIRTEFFARSVKESMFPRPDSFQLYFTVQEMMKEKGILYATVLNDKGEILSHNAKEKIGQIDRTPVGISAGDVKDIHTQTYLKGQETLYDISVPVMIGADIKVGTVRIGFSQASISKALIEKRNEIIRITILMLLIGIIGTSLVVTFMVNPVNQLAYAARQIGEGNLDQEIKIKSKDEIGQLARAFKDMINGLKERDLIRNTFGKYVTKQVAEAILNGRLELGGERKKATILMSDIRGFTSMSEKLPPEEVVEFLNKYFTIMVEIIIRYEGTLDKFIGDALLAVFGAPISHDDDSRRAVLAGLEMKDALAKFNVQREKEGKLPIKIGIAIHTGEVVAGNIGSEVRMEYTVIGNTVNLASRVEKLNKQLSTMSLITESTYQEVKDMVEVREIEKVGIRGIETPVKIYELLGRK
ncbi:MAG: adenylate/guanylate cyclase domain-containing protein [bacterium]